MKEDDGEDGDIGQDGSENNDVEDVHSPRSEAERTKLILRAGRFTLILRL